MYFQHAVVYKYKLVEHFILCSVKQTKLIRHAFVNGLKFAYLSRLFENILGENLFIKWNQCYVRTVREITYTLYWIEQINV